VVLATVALAVLAVGAGVASAHTTSFNSTVTIDYDAGFFFGTVSSPKPGCVPNRLVKLFREEGNNDTFLGSDRTDQEGDWEIASGISAGTPYYVKVTRKDIGGSAHDHVCKAAKSGNLAVLP
jgi:hypothetical protein